VSATVCHDLGQDYSLTSNPGRTLWTPVGSSRIEGRRIGARGITRGLRLKEPGTIAALEILILSNLKCITLLIIGEVGDRSWAPAPG